MVGTLSGKTGLARSMPTGIMVVPFPFQIVMTRLPASYLGIPFSVAQLRRPRDGSSFLSLAYE